jgi:hypothetical protein
MATATYGNSTEEAHQKKLATIRHFKSIEAAVLGFKPSSTIGTIKADIVAGYTNRQANTTPGIMAGFPYYISRVGGATAFNAAGRFGNILAVDGDKDWTGTPAALTKGMIEDLAKIVYDNGATMKTVYVGASLKRRINELYPRQWANEQSIRSNVLDVDTAVGVIKFKLHRLLSDAYGLGDVMLGGDFEFAKLMILREDIKLLPEIETAKKWLLYSSLTLQVSNAAAFAMLVGVTV